MKESVNWEKCHKNALATSESHIYMVIMDHWKCERTIIVHQTTFFLTFVNTTNQFQNIQSIFDHLNDYMFTIKIKLSCI